MRKLVVLLYDYLDTMARPWLDNGYDVLSVDGKHPQGITASAQPNGATWYKMGMWFSVPDLYEQAMAIAQDVNGSCIAYDVGLVFGFPECTYLTVAGNRWLYHPEDKHLTTSERRPHPLYPNRRADRADAVELARFVPMVAVAFCCRSWAFENPRQGHLNTAWRGPDVWFDPCEYGGYLPADHQHKHFPDIYPGRDAYRKPTGIWHSRYFAMPERKPVEPVGKDFPGWAKCGGRSAKTKEIRSSTPEGFALAVYEANKW